MAFSRLRSARHGPLQQSASLRLPSSDPPQITHTRSSEVASMDAASQPQRMIAYLRVSTDEQAMSGLGLEAQEATLRRAFEYRGWELAELVREEGISGSTLDRP